MGIATGRKWLSYLFRWLFFIGEIVERVDPHKRSISSFLQEEICSKIGAQYYMGLPENFDEGRLSRHYTAKFKINNKDPSTKAMMDPTSLASKSYNSVKFNVWKSRHYEIPSALGFASASGIAAILSILANDGTVDGVTFIKPQTVKKVMKSIGKCKDLVLMKDKYRTQGGFETHPNNPNIIWHAGWGGSLGFVDNHYKMSFGYVTNTSIVDLEENEQYHQGPRQSALLDAVYKCLRKKSTSKL